QVTNTQTLSIQSGLKRFRLALEFCERENFTLALQPGLGAVLRAKFENMYSGKYDNSARNKPPKVVKSLKDLAAINGRRSRNPTSGEKLREQAERSYLPHPIGKKRKDQIVIAQTGPSKTTGDDAGHPIL